jgi:hypothetical protein
LSFIDKFKLTHRRHLTWYEELLAYDYTIFFIEGTKNSYLDYISRPERKQNIKGHESVTWKKVEIDSLETREKDDIKKAWQIHTDRI